MPPEPGMRFSSGIQQSSKINSEVIEARMLNFRRVDSNDCQVSLWIGPNKLGRKDARVMQRYLKVARTVDHVAVCQNESIRRENKPRTGSVAPALLVHFNLDDRRAYTFGGRNNGFGIGV